MITDLSVPANRPTVRAIAPNSVPLSLESIHMRGSRGMASRGRGLCHGGICIAPHMNTLE
jgi:hypothetical protein